MLLSSGFAEYDRFSGTTLNAVVRTLHTSGLSEAQCLTYMVVITWHYYTSCVRNSGGRMSDAQESTFDQDGSNSWT